jgi:hypothetical protein
MRSTRHQSMESDYRRRFGSRGSRFGFGLRELGISGLGICGLYRLLFLGRLVSLLTPATMYYLLTASVFLCPQVVVAGI